MNIKRTKGQGGKGSVVLISKKSTLKGKVETSLFERWTLQRQTADARRMIINAIESEPI